MTEAQPTPLSIEELLAQGACCGSGCRNCPYEPRHTKGATVVYDPHDAEWEGWPVPPTRGDA